jgi:3'-phosphoadenosine 5'-phosphosulfate sulfotransferase (PAPS reductase)/FAD synthetase
MTNEFLLMDRLQKIRQVIQKYGEENFYLSFSGGKDSTVLSALIDMALPGNKIPRVYANTGIEYNIVLDFVERERERASVGAHHNKAVSADPRDAGKRRLSIQEQTTCRDAQPLSEKRHVEVGEVLSRRRV